MVFSPKKHCVASAVGTDLPTAFFWATALPTWGALASCLVAGHYQYMMFWQTFTIKIVLKNITRGLTSIYGQYGPDRTERTK
jgi:hypothetical protein